MDAGGLLGADSRCHNPVIRGTDLMTTLPVGGRRRPHPPRRGGRRLLLLPLVAFAAPALIAFVYIAYVLWPRWPGPPVGLDAPALPITIAGVAFNIPPAAIRVPVQRRPGAQERVDLAFLWPSLAPPDPNAKAPAREPGTLPLPTQTFARLFMTIAGAGDTLAPAERVLNIYPRYVAAEARPGPGGLGIQAFRDGTPYQGEDLIYDGTPPSFLVRCTRDRAGPTPGICLYERRIDTADIVVRFPRDWLGDWRLLAGSIDRLIASLRAARG
jgi:hypothetical protein